LRSDLHGAAGARRRQSDRDADRHAHRDVGGRLLERCDSASGSGCTVTVSGSDQVPTVVTATFALERFTWSFVNRGLDGASGTLTYPVGSCRAAAPAR